MDNGVPPTSKRAGSRTSGGGVVKPDAKGATPKPDGGGSTRRGPVDPRTEDPSAPAGISRSGKVVRRPGTAMPRTTKHRESGSIDAPIEFSVSLPLDDVRQETPETPEAREANEADTEHVETADTEPVSLAPSVEFFSPGASAFTPTLLVPSSPAPTELVPEEPRTTAVPVTVPAPILYDEAATIDDVTRIGPVLETRPLRRPVHFRRAPKPRVRRVTRVVRHVDTWSIFKVALVFNVFFYAVALVSGVLLWQVAYATGTIDNIEKFFEGFGWETFNFNGGQIFHNAWIAGLFVAVGLTGLAVLLATLFNLITDLVGGVRFSVLEEEVQARAERGIELVLDDSTAAAVADQQLFDDGRDFGATAATKSNGEAIAG